MVEEAHSAVEDHPAEVTMMPKFDMSCHEPTMSSKDYKSLALRHGIPLDLHPCASSEGWTIDQLPEEVIGIVPTVNLFRVFYKVSKQGHRFSSEKRVGKGAGGRVFRETFSGMKGWKKDVQKLTERFIDLRSVPVGLLFRGGLTTTRDFLSFHPIFEDTKGNVIIMFEYLRFPFLSGASIVQGTALSSKDLVAQHTAPLLLVDQALLKKTDFQREVEVEDPKIVAARERKAQAAAKRKESRKRGGDEGEGSKPKTKRKKVLAVRKGGSASSKNVSSSNLLRTVGPTDNVVGNLSDTGTKADESHGNHSETNSLRLESFVNQSGRDLNADKTKSNALTNPIALERAWFSLARWAMAQANNLERFENLQDDYTKLAEAHRECSDTVRKLVTARQDLEHNAKLYTNMTDRYKGDQALRIRELEVELAKKDSAFIHAERISVDRATEKEKLVTQLSQAEIKKFDCIRKLLPIVSKGLAEGRSEKDIMAALHMVENFDPYSDRKLYPMYDKLFEKKYPYVKKIVSGFRHSIADLLKAYPDPAPSSKTFVVLALKVSTGPHVSSVQKKT
ncbi:hypothetical protein Tco_0864330 [Tanacetum coccineum]